MHYCYQFEQTGRSLFSRVNDASLWVGDATDLLHNTIGTVQLQPGVVMIMEILLASPASPPA
jgi:hypothetical protein